MNPPIGNQPKWPFGVTDPGLYEDALRKLVKEHNLAADKLTENQLAECIRQALACGDFVKYVAHRYDPVKMTEDAMHFNPYADPTTILTLVHKQSVVYIPYREVEQLKARIKELEDQIEQLGQWPVGEM